MNELKKTMIFGGAAIGLLLLAFITAPSPEPPDQFFDLGEEFFPEFIDPNEAVTLEVIDYDAESGAAVPFKVTSNNGVWTIPSHNNYPADGKDRLAKTAAGVIGIKKDDFRTDNPADYDSCNVIDPLDEGATSADGRGKRVTLKGANDKILADFIIGKKVPDRDNFRFVRLPEKKRVYAVRMDIDLSTKFADWIETDLMKVDKDKIDTVVLKDYSVNERTRALDQRDEVNLSKDGSDWKANKMSAKQEIDKTKMNDFLKAVDELAIVGVRPKPAGLNEILATAKSGQVTQELLSQLGGLQSKGYYLAGNGELVSNEGEVQAATSEGVEYTLRFGEIVYGSGDAVSAGDDEVNANSESGPGENRYLFISTAFDSSKFPEPEAPANMEFQSKADSLWSNDDHKNKELFDGHDKWKKDVEKGVKAANDLNDRFSEWYYVISSESFDKIHLKRSDLVKAKEEDEK